MNRLCSILKIGISYLLIINNIKKGSSFSDFVLISSMIIAYDAALSRIFSLFGFLKKNSLVIEDTIKVLELDVNLDYRDLTCFSGGTVSKESQSDRFNNKSGKGHEIIFENVSYHFPDADGRIFENLSFKIEKNERIALIGLNGAGKTTLVKLLSGLYKPTSGRILIDDTDISTLGKDEVYNLFSVVFQDYIIFPFSIAENVSGKLLKDTSMDKVLDCLEMVGLSDKINSLENGVYSNLLKYPDEDGVLLSEGQSQKLIIARALYKDGDILILDEPSSALDAAAEENLYRSYSRLATDRTSVFISHRLNSTSFCSKILLLDNGSIVDYGSHNDLIKRCEKYKRMYDIQSSQYREGEKTEKQ